MALCCTAASVYGRTHNILSTQRTIDIIMPAAEFISRGQSHDNTFFPFFLFFLFFLLVLFRKPEKAQATRTFGSWLGESGLGALLGYCCVLLHANLLQDSGYRTHAA